MGSAGIDSTGAPVAWQVGTPVAIRALIAEREIAQNVAYQLVAPVRRGLIAEAGPQSASIELDDGSEHLVALLKTQPGQSGPYLVAGVGAQTLTDTDPSQLSWVGRPDPLHPETVRARLDGRFRIVAETATASGLRRPQVGAIYSVLGYWTTDPSKEATVVMPTGTGKTDTMVALFAAACPARLLVMVPSDALRTQVAEKFQTGASRFSGV